MTHTRPLGPFAILFEPRAIPAAARQKKPSPNVTNSQRSTTSLETPEERKQRRADKLLAFHPMHSHNFAQLPVPSKVISVAAGKFATV